MVATATARLAANKEATTMVETMIATDLVAREETTMDSPETPTATAAQDKLADKLAA